MKKILPLLLIAMAITTYVACVPKHGTKALTAAFSIEYEPDDGPLSEQDFYFTATSALTDPTLRDLVDVCNAHAIMHNARSDFEYWVRFGVITPGTIMSAKPDVIADTKLRGAVRRYLLQVSALIDTTADADNRIDALDQAFLAYRTLDSIIAVDYNVDRYVRLDDTTYWKHYDKTRVDKNYDQIEAKFGSNDGQLISMLRLAFARTKDIDRKCVIALELAHVTDATDDAGISVAAPLLLQCMQQGQYSIYLMEVWWTWRTLVQLAHGASKDADLLNQCFNKAKMACLYTILQEVGRTGGDRFAINELLVLSSIENIYRYGAFAFGNQNLLDYYQIFPEWFDDGDDNAADADSADE